MVKGVGYIYISLGYWVIDTDVIGGGLNWLRLYASSLDDIKRVSSEPFFSFGL